MTDLILTEIVTDSTPVIETVEVSTVTLEIVEVALQGPRGIQGIPGPAGGAAFQRIAGEPISGHRAVRAVNGLIYYCDADDVTQAGECIGISLNAAVTGDSVTIQALGEVTEPSWNFSAGPLFVRSLGQIGGESGREYTQEIGLVITPNTIFINIQPAIIRSF